MHAYWRAANYLSVGQIYLMDNPLLKEPLAAQARQAASARALGNHVGPELPLRPPESGHQGVRPEHALHLRPRARRAGPGGQRLPGRDVQRGLPQHRPGRGGHETAVHAVLVPRRHPQPRRPGDARLDPRRRRVGLRPVARLRGGLRQPRPDRRLRHRRRRGGDRARWPPAGTATSSSTRFATAACCRSCTSTATRSPIPRCWPASATRSWTP